MSSHQNGYSISRHTLVVCLCRSTSPVFDGGVVQLGILIQVLLVAAYVKHCVGTDFMVDSMYCKLIISGFCPWRRAPEVAPGAMCMTACAHRGPPGRLGHHEQ